MQILIAKNAIIFNYATNKEHNNTKDIKGKFVLFLLKIIKNYFTSFSI